MLNTTDTAFQKLILNVDKRIGLGVPEPVVIDALQESFRKFCEDTECWLLKTEHDVASGTTGYSAVGTADALVRRIVSVKLKAAGDAREFCSVEQVNPGVYDESDNTVQFHKAANLDCFNGGKLEIIASLTPDASSTGIDENMAKRYGNALVYGAIAEIALQKNRPWYDPDLYGLYVGKFHAEETHALANMADGFKTTSSGFTG